MLNLPIELIDKIVCNTRSVPILAYYIIRYKPSARFIASIADMQKAFDTYAMHDMAGTTLFDMDDPYRAPVELLFDETSLRLGSGLLYGMDVISACCNKFQHR